MSKREEALDLNNKQHSMDELKKNIYAIGLNSILNTQKIDEVFAVNYILNKNFQLTDEEESITFDYVLKKQPHLDKNKLLRLYFIGPVDNKFPNFEEYARQA
jgi:hypothetical protein